MNTADALMRIESLLGDGAFGEAKALTLTFLAKDAREPGALRLLAAIAEAEGDLDEADRLYGDIADANPADEIAVDSLIRISHLRGDFQRLKQALLARLQLTPGRGDLWSDLGAASERLGQPSNAEAAYRCATAIEPALATAVLNRASLAYRLSNYEIALKLSQRACAAGARPGDTWLIMGHTNQQMGKPDLAVRAYKRALSLDPGSVPTLQGLAAALRVRKAHDRASVLLVRAISITPDDPMGLANLAEAYRTQENLAEAQPLSRRAIVLAPGSAFAANTLALTQADLALDLSALSWSRRAVCIDPNQLDLLVNLGFSLKALGHFGAAERVIRQGLKLSPNAPQAHMSLAMTLLAAGRIEEGLREYEWRHVGSPSRYDFFSATRWNGQPLREGKLLVWGEQGLGDEIIYGSMLPDLERSGIRAIVECDARLVSLYARAMPTLDFVARNHPPDQRLEADDIVAQVPMGSLARRYRARIEHFPSKGGYLKPRQDLLDHWRRRLAELGDGPKIGFAWRSLRMSVSASRSHPPIAEWAPVLAQRGVTFISLQYGESECDIQAVSSKLGTTVHKFPDLDLMNDLEGVLALAAALDMTISSGSTAFCLPAATGLPVWLLTFDTDFWMYGTGDYPWFPNIRVYSHHCTLPWSTTIGRIGSDLASSL